METLYRTKMEVDRSDQFIALFGLHDENLKLIRDELGVEIFAHGSEITISGEVRGSNIIFCISDEGPGIDPNDLPFVFDRFYRSQNAIKQTKGAGLGLYLSRAIIEAHEGRIWIDTEHGKGARICFSLPISKN